MEVGQWKRLRGGGAVPRGYEGWKKSARGQKNERREVTLRRGGRGPGGGVTRARRRGVRKKVQWRRKQTARRKRLREGEGEGGERGDQN